jgi:hypothetical protein
MSAGVFLGGGLQYKYLFYAYSVLNGLSALLAFLMPLPGNMRCGNVLKNMRKILTLPKVGLTMTFEWYKSV